MFEETILDHDGEIVLINNFFKDDFFEVLLNEVNWRQDCISMYGKQHPVPRLQAWYADTGIEYSYSGILLERNDWSSCLIRIKTQIERHFDVLLNGALANYYRDGSDYCSWHSDNESELDSSSDIFSVSLGEQRDFSFKHNSKDIKGKISLENNSLLIMKPPFQENYKHQLNKTKKPKSGRINITFRKLK
jgi:alkylated DNA repair dioxygenase AlkB